MSYNAHTMETQRFALLVRWVSDINEYVASIRRISDNALMFSCSYENIDDAVYEAEQALLSFEHNRGGW